MKRIIRTLAVTTLTSCLTTLQISTALAQNIESLLDMEIEEAERVIQLRKFHDFATPSFILAPQFGSEIETSYSYSDSSLKYRGSSIERQFNSHSGRLEMAVALTPHYFAGFGVQGIQKDTNVTDSVVDTKEEVEGFSEPFFILGARINKNSISSILEVGLQLPYGSSSGTLEKNGVYKRDAKEGRSSVTPKLTIFSNKKSSILLGAQGSYTFKQKGTVNHSDESGFQPVGRPYDVTGGNLAVMKVFAETPQTSHSFGAALIYSVFEDENIETNPVAKSVRKGSELATVTAYGNIVIASQFSVRPAMSYSRYLNDRVEDLELKDQRQFEGMITARLTF